MKSPILLGTTLAAALAAAAFAETPAQAQDLRATLAQLERGERALTRAGKAPTRAARLRILEYATTTLRDVRRDAERRESPVYGDVWRDAGASLVRSLVCESQIHLERGSLPNARDRALAALAVAPNDPRALNLIARIDAVEREDLYDEDEVGTVAIQRIRERRLAQGLPIRDRGMARRR